MYENYCKIRDSLGLKDSDVAKLAGVPKSTFSDWKSGRSKPKAEKLDKIATALNVSIQELMGWEETPTEEKYNEVMTHLDAEIRNDEEMRKLLKKYFLLKKSDKERLNRYMEMMIDDFYNKDKN